MRTLNVHYANAVADSGLEADERDALFDFVGRHFTGLPWPRSGSIDANKPFTAKLHDAITATRWKVDLLSVDPLT